LERAKSLLQKLFAKHAEPGTAADRPRDGRFIQLQRRARVSRLLSWAVRRGKATGKETLMSEKKGPGKLADGKGTQKPTKSTGGKASKGFTDEERAAMRERAQELKAAARRAQRADKADGESEVLAKIAEMPEPDRTIAGRLHAIIKASAPALSPRTWYGMPAYAKDGNVVCFFQSAQ